MNLLERKEATIMKDIVKMYKRNAENILRLCNGYVGFLVPKLENGKIVECSFIRSANANIKNRPFAWVGFDPDSGAVLYYKHCSYDDFVCTDKYPPTTTISGEYISERNVDQQELFEKQLFNNYMNLREFVFKEKISEEQREIVRDFRKIWNITVLNDLKPYYEALSPEFFSWLDEMALK